jgi:dihydroorotate dehydrogenase (fumarate)
MTIDLRVRINSKLELPNPLIIASGPSIKNDIDILRGIQSGAGGVVTKTITYDPLQQIQPKPRMYVVDRKTAILRTKFYSFYSIDLMSEYPPEKWPSLIKNAKSEISRKGLEGVIIASIAGRTYEEWERLTKLITEAEADAIELNLSCPHIEPEAGKLMGRAVTQDLSIVANIVKTVKENTYLPVIGKLTPHGANPLELAKVMVKNGADALVSTARFQGLIIDINTMKPIEWGGLGGYGGPWQLPISLAWTYNIVKVLPDVPVIGSGGISSGHDVVRFILVGAKAAQSCTTILLHGYDIIKVMLNELIGWMTEHGFTRIEEFRGLSLKYILSLDELNRTKKYVFSIDAEKCILCGICVRVCPYGAIRKANNKIEIDNTICDNCGLCYTICPHDAITRKELLAK